MSPEVHIGTMGWSYSFWVDNFYQKGLSPEAFLSDYAKHFETVEADSTFYGVPSEDTVVKWRSQTPANFMFSVKFPRIITHDKMLKNVERETERFVGRMSQLQNKLGPMLLQFPYSFKGEHVHLLDDFLPRLPREYRFAVEVRNAKLLNDDLYSLLRKNNVALVWATLPFLPPADVVTAEFVYIRWEGDRRKVQGTLGKVETDRTSDITQWAEKIKKLLSNELEVFGYYSKYYSGHPPTDAKQLLEKLNQ